VCGHVEREAVVRVVVWENTCHCSVLECMLNFSRLGAPENVHILKHVTVSLTLLVGLHAACFLFCFNRFISYTLGSVLIKAFLLYGALLLSPGTQSFSCSGINVLYLFPKCWSGFFGRVIPLDSVVLWHPVNCSLSICSSDRFFYRERGALLVQSRLSSCVLYSCSKSCSTGFAVIGRYVGRVVRFFQGV